MLDRNWVYNFVKSRFIAVSFLSFLGLNEYWSYDELLLLFTDTAIIFV